MEKVRIDKFIIGRYGGYADERLRLVAWGNREEWDGDSYIPMDFISPSEDNAAYLVVYDTPIDYMDLFDDDK